MQKFTTQGARRAIPAGENACADAPRLTIMSAAYFDVRILRCLAMQSLFAVRLSSLLCGNFDIEALTNSLPVNHERFHQGKGQARPRGSFFFFTNDGKRRP